MSGMGSPEQLLLRPEGNSRECKRMTGILSEKGDSDCQSPFVSCAPFPVRCNALWLLARLEPIDARRFERQSPRLRSPVVTTAATCNERVANGHLFPLEETFCATPTMAETLLLLNYCIVRSTHISLTHFHVDRTVLHCLPFPTLEAGMPPHFGGPISAVSHIHFPQQGRVVALHLMGELELLRELRVEQLEEGWNRVWLCLLLGQHPAASVVVAREKRVVSVPPRSRAVEDTDGNFKKRTGGRKKHRSEAQDVQIKRVRS